MELKYFYPCNLMIITWNIPYKNHVIEAQDFIVIYHSITLWAFTESRTTFSSDLYAEGVRPVSVCTLSLLALVSCSPRVLSSAFTLCGCVTGSGCVFHLHAQSSRCCKELYYLNVLIYKAHAQRRRDWNFGNLAICHCASTVHPRRNYFHYLHFVASDYKQLIMKYKVEWRCSWGIISCHLCKCLCGRVSL